MRRKILYLGPEAYVESLGQRVCQRTIARLNETMVPIEGIFIVLRPVFGGEVVNVGRWCQRACDEEERTVEGMW